MFVPSQIFSVVAANRNVTVKSDFVRRATRFIWGER